MIVIDRALRGQNESILHRGAGGRVEVDGRAGSHGAGYFYIKVSLHNGAILARIAAIDDDVERARRQSKESAIGRHNCGIHVRKADDANRDAIPVNARGVKRIQVVLHRKITWPESQKWLRVQSPLRRYRVRLGLKRSLT